MNIVLFDLARKLRVPVAAAFCLMTSPAWANLDPSGDLDTTFNGTGNVVTNVAVRNTFSDARGSVVQPDGRIVIAGDYDAGGGLVHISLTRYNADGSVDGSFGSGGEVKTTLSSNDLVFGVALTSTGKIVVVGSVNIGGSEDFFATRYTSSGVLDTTFNGTGFVTVEVGVNTTGPCFDRAQAVAVQADDKIIVAGYSDNINGAVNNGRDAAFVRLNTNGTLDATFGTGGKKLVQFVPNSTTTVERALAVTIQPSDQKIVAGGRGSSTQFSLLRLNTNGSLDAGFGTGGIVLSTFGSTSGPDRFQALGIDSSGKIVGAGLRYTGIFGMAVARFNTNGTFDTTFNGSGWNSVNILGGQDQCRAMGIQPSDGKILCSGVADSDGSGNFKMFATRFNTNGSLDTTFASSGKFSIDASGTGLQNDALAGVMQSDSKYVIVGTAYPAGSVTSTEIAAIRLTTAGALDTTFDSDGIVFRQLQGGSTDYAYGVAAQSDGKLVVAGSTADATSGNIVVARYNTNGSLDTGWGSTGLVITAAGNYNEDGHAVLVQPDQKIVVGGTRISLTAPSPPHQLIAVRYNSNGTLDGAFGTGGIASAPLGSNGGAGYAVARQSDGKILVAGSFTNTAAEWNYYVARFTSAGALDGTFGSGGTVNINVSSGAVDEAQAIALQSDGKILLAGYAFVGGGSQFALVRLNANGSTDNTFGTSGIVKTAIGDPTNQRNRLTGVVQLPDGRLIAGGTGNDGTAGAVPVFRLVRYNANGSLDASYGTGGISTYSIMSGTRYSNMYALGLQYDEKVVAFGDTTLLPGGTQDFALARFNWDDGSLDSTYGTNGQVIDPITPGLEGGYSGILLSDGHQVMAGLAQQSDFGVAKFLGDPAPTLPGVPDLTTDSGISATDNITNVNTPTFASSCNVGDTVWLTIDNAVTTPATRAICRATPQSITLPTALTDGVHTIGAFARNNSGDSATTTNLSVTIDTVVNPVSISAPAAAANVAPNPSISGTGAENGAAVNVTESGNPVCSGTGAADFSWSCAATLGQGAHTVSAKQTDIAGNVSTAVTRSFNVKSLTTTTIVSSANPSKSGQTVIFTATVTPSGAHNLSVTGTAVRFLIDSVQVSAPTLDVNGQATFSPTGLGLAVGTHTVQAIYDENANWFGSSANLAPDQVVQKADTATSVTSGANPSAFGQSVTFTATVAAVSPGAGAPSGTVTFLDGGSSIGTGTLSGGVATLTTSSLAVGSHVITTDYVGDGNFNGSAGSLAANPQVVNKSNTATAVTSSQNPSLLNQSVTFTATVSAVAPGAGAPSGTVTFLDGGSSIGSGALAGGVATFATSTLTVGNHTITTTYAGDGNFNGSAGSLTGNPQVVNKLPTTTSLTSSQNPSKFGESVTFSATVAPSPPGSGTPTGTVTFLDGGSSIGSGTLDGAGLATLTTSTLAPGSHTVTASYGGDATFAVSTGSLTGNPQIVNKADTTTTVTSSANPSVVGQAATFTATVTPVAPGAGTPTGTVTFLDGASSIGTGMLNAGVATLTTSALTVGNHAITTSYAGDANFNASASSLTGNPQVVDKADTTTALASSQNPSLPGQSVTFTATVSPLAPGAGTPTGTIDFLDGGNPLGSGALSAGVATFTTSALAAGSHTITTSYGGDGDFNASAGSLTGNPQIVSKVGTTTTIDSFAPPSPITVGSSVSVSASVAASGPGPGTPSGTIVVSDGAAAAGDTCTIALPATSCSLTPSSTGNQAVVGTYSGDSTFLASTSVAMTLSVTPPTRTISASAGPNGSISPASQFVVDGNSAIFAVTPNSGYTTSIGGTCPAGTLNNNMYTTGVISGDCTVVATFSSASASITLGITDNRLFARYGSLVNYVVTASNSSGADVTGLSISGGTSPDLDASSGHWLCFSSATHCAPSGNGAFTDNAVSIPANGSVNWLVTLPVLENAPDATVSYAVTLDGPSFASPITQTDADTLVIYRDGFDIPYGDGTQIINPIDAADAMTNWDGSSALTLSIHGAANALIESPLSASGPDNSGFRIERLNGATQIWLRVVSIDALGNERASVWTKVAPNALLTIGMAKTNAGPTLILIGGEDEIQAPLPDASSWQLRAPGTR